jgi:septum site-determining protein MinD
LWILELFKRNKNQKKEEVPVFYRRPIPGRIVVFTSGKGGVGKTTLSTSVAYVLAEAGKKVLLVDLDTGLRNIDILLSVSDKITYNLYDVTEKKIPWQKALVSPVQNLYVLVSDHLREKEAIRKDAFELALYDMARHFDFIVLDCPAGIEYGFRLAVACADEAIVVAGPDMPSLRGAAQVTRILRSKKPCVGVVNKVIPELKEKGLCAGKKEAEEILEIPVTAEIPLDNAVVGCAHAGIPIMSVKKESPFKKEVRKFVYDRYSLGVFEKLQKTPVLQQGV